MFPIPVMDAIKQNYEQFRLQTYQYRHEGLFHDEKNIYAVVSEVDRSPTDRENLEKALSQYNSLTIPTPKIICKASSEFQPIPLRDIYQKIYLHGNSVTHDEFFNDLTILIPKEYHPFNADVQFWDKQFKLTFKKKLTEEQKLEITLLCESTGYQGFSYSFKHNPNLSEFPGVVEKKANSHNNLHLTASGLMRNQFSRPVLDAYEEDQEFWYQNKHSILTGDCPDKSAYLPSNFNSGESSCFIDASVFRRENLRVYLSLYEKIIIALPLADSELATSFYDSFKINNFELKELIQRGRLLFVAYQNLHRYDKDLLNDILSTDPNCIIFSRKLSASTLTGIQAKSGILGRTFDSDEQYQFLNHCHSMPRTEISTLIKCLSEQWQIAEYAINKEGATSVYHAGMSRFAAQIFKDRGRDLFIEFCTASSSLEFAQGLNAHHFPYDSAQYSEVEACKCLSSFYNGFTESNTTLRESELSKLLSQVLTINNDMSILELDDVISGINTRSLPSLLSNFSNLSDEEREYKLYILNKELSKIERNKNRLQALDFTGSIMPSVAGAVMVFNNIPEGGYLPLGSIFLKYLQVYGKDSALLKSPIFDSFSAMNHRVSKESIIVSNYRSRIKTIR